MDAQRALLDQLMGRNRNIHPDEGGAVTLKWSDSEVCEWFLCGFCPLEQFMNTRNDIGICSKTHDERLREDFERVSQSHQWQYKRRFLRFLESRLEDVVRAKILGHTPNYAKDKSDTS
eukprot:787552_1